MKCTIFIEVCAGLLLLTACENELEKTVGFNAGVCASESFTTDTDGVIHAPAGTNITFDFSGDPDFISFSYELFNKTTPELRFNSVLSWNNDTGNTLQLYASGSFAGLSKTDAHADSIAIANHDWVNLSSQCVFPTERNGSANSSVSLEQYRGSSVVLALRYKTYNNTGFQPMWTINDFQIVNTIVKTGGDISFVAAATMGLTPFDMFSLTPNDAPYQSSSSGGVWDTSTPASLKIRQTPANRDLNEDWLISKPIEVSSGVIIKGPGTPIKDITNKVSFYTHTFKEEGEYTVTFTATNYNFEAHSEVKKTFRINIE
jgi:hypothetical protein